MRDRKWMRSVLWSGAFTVLSSAAAVAAPHGHAALRAPNSCQPSADAAFRACQAGALDDRWLAFGRCANVADANAKKACRKQAVTDRQDALQTCKSQHAARGAVCGRLGAGPYSPAIDPANFVAAIDNPLFPLKPGTTFVYEGQTAQGFEHDEFAVTHNTKVILGVTCVEVHDTVTTNGELTEDTLDWFAQDKDGNVWYFGENTKQLAGGLVVGLEGAWTSGVDGAQPGIVMGAHPAVRDFYRQEYLLADAEDLAEVVSLDEAVTAGGKTYDHTLKTKETSPLEPDVTENKYYAAEVGNVLVVDLTSGEKSELVQITTE